MKNLRRLILFVFICILFGCKKNKYIFHYDKTLARTLTLELNCNIFDTNKSIEKLDSINFYDLKNGVEVLTFCKSNLQLINFFERIKISNKMICYGGKIIRNNNFFLFSFNEMDNEYQYKKLGYLAIINEINKKITYVKIFESEMESPTFFRSFYLNNYLLLLKSNDESYDILDENNIKPINEYFCVLKILEDGNIHILEEKESDLILKNEFKLE